MEEACTILLRFPCNSEWKVFWYRNYKGEFGERHVMLQMVWLGISPYHEDQQWFLRGFDKDRQAMRDFALRDVFMKALQ